MSLFLNFNPGGLRKRAVLKQPSVVPNTGWLPPSFLPDIRDASLISFDTETKENDFESGPGWSRNAGHIVGLSVTAISPKGDRWTGYLPVRHEVETHLNMDARGVFAWAKTMLETDIPKTGANLIYDMGWLGEEGIRPGGKLYDVQFAEALLDEQAPTNLDHLAAKYLRRGKNSAALYYYLHQNYGGNPNDQRENIYRAPPQLVGPYAEADAYLPPDILYAQWYQLAEQGLLDLYEMECKLIRILIKMRQTGVRIDMDYAEKLYSELGGDVTRLEQEFAYKYGKRVNVNSGDELAPLFDSHGIKYPRTEPSARNPNGKASFQKDWLKNLEHPIGSDVNRIRELMKLRSTFIRGYMLEKNVAGRIHCSFHPLRNSKVSDANDTAGAKTGRFASSDPNLQNIPIRSDEGKRIRKAFVPDYGHCGWEKDDYSQIEYRFLAHFACDAGDGSADALRQTYINDPSTDYHDVVYYRVCPYMGWDANDAIAKIKRRRPIKNTNFGLVYGQGQGKLARTMGFTPEQAREFFTAYHAGAPYVKPTMDACAKEVHSNGFITTILGRRTRFNEWVPFSWREEGAKPLRYEDALRHYGSNIQRAYDYRAINYRLQGSAADQMKKAIVRLDDEGVFDIIGVPKLTVHDELDFSVIDDTPAQREAYLYMRHVMETAITLRVPVRVDSKRGPSWGDID